MANSLECSLPLAPLPLMIRSAIPSRLSSEIRTPRVIPKKSIRVLREASRSAMARLACRWVFFRASLSALSAIWNLIFGTLFSSSARWASSPALYCSTAMPCPFRLSTSAALALSGRIAAFTSSNPTARWGFASKYPVGIAATSLYSCRIIAAVSLLML